MMNRLLKKKVIFSKPIWFVVSFIVFVDLSRTIIVHKGNDIVRLYQLWIYPFQFESYRGATFEDIVSGIFVISLFTAVILILAALAGWLVAAVVGSGRMLITERGYKDRTTGPTVPPEAGASGVQ